jgi:hypothetical protein
MATNLQFIKSASATSVSFLQITDCFNANYDVYQVHIDSDNSNNADLYTRVINDSGTVISSGSKYDFASHELNASGSFGEYRNTGANQFEGIGFTSTTGNSTVAYFYNPHNSSSYTFSMSESSSMYTTTLRGGKSIGVYKNADTITGLEIRDNGTDFAYINVSVYGVK